MPTVTWTRCDAYIGGSFIYRLLVVVTIFVLGVSSTANAVASDSSENRSVSDRYSDSAGWLPIEIRVNISYDSRDPESMMDDATPPADERAPASFFDTLFYLELIAVALIGLLDWLIGKNGRKILKEYVADVWTRLQYTSIDTILRRRFLSAIGIIHQLLGTSSISPRRIAIPLCLHLVISYFLCWSFLRVLIGSDFGPFWHPALIIYPTAVNGALIIATTVWLLSASWVGWSAIIFGLNTANARHPRLRFLAVAVGSLAIILLLSIAYLSAIFKLSHLMATLRELHAGIMLKHNVEFTINGARSQFVEAVIAELDLVIRNAVNLFFLYVSLIFVISWTVGPYVLILFIGVVLIVIDLLGRLIRPIAQPATSLVLQRLYESDQGVLTQVGIFLAASAKVVEEGAKRFL